MQYDYKQYPVHFIGSIAYCYKEILQDAARQTGIQIGKCPVEELISKIAKPEDALEAMKEWAADPGKVFRILVEM